MEPKEYTIQELTELSGVPRRTVHFYTQQGILPPPQGAGLGARYSDLHLLRLKAVPVLRARGLRLDEIRQRLSGLDLEATRELLAAPSPETPAPTAERRAIRAIQPVWPASPASPTSPASPASSASSASGREEPPDGTDPSLPTGRSYLHYPLPGGLELSAPADLDPALRRKLLRLLQEAKRILEDK